MKRKEIINISKKRKTPQGEFRNSERTKRKLVNSIGKIIKYHGYNGINVNRIQELSGVDKKLIYFHFGGVSNLVEAYLQEADYWENLNNAAYTEEIRSIEPGKDELIQLLQNQFNFFYKNKESQGMILWEISEKNKYLRKIADKREEMGKQLFSLIDSDFTNTNLDIRALNAILISGIYYLVLHAKNNGSTFCEIDINKPGDKQRIAETIEEVVSLFYKEAKLRK